MSTSRWVFSLTIGDESIESRISRVVAYLCRQGTKQWTVSGLDATGRTGALLTRKNNEQPGISLSCAELQTLLAEDGQIIEGRFSSGQRHGRYDILVQDGAYVDVSGDGPAVPEEHLGPAVSIVPEEYFA
jgi:hypothetical protein